MARKLSAKAQQKLNDDRVSRVYGERCSGIQVDIFDLGKIDKVGHAAIAEGADDQALGDAIAAFVETIRKN